MIKVSLVSATYNRASLLDNALSCFSRQTLNNDEWEYLICDDMSTDNTREVVDSWVKKGLPLRYFTADELGCPKVPGQWRDGCKLRNKISTFANGRVLLATHPEIMVTNNALEVMYETTVSQQGRSWVTAVPYWLPNSALVEGWREDIMKLRGVEGFYSPDWPNPQHSPGAPDYTNQNQERRNTWESEVFFAMKMADWRWIGGFREFDAWGSVDMDFLSRRASLKIKTVIAKGSDVPSGNLMVFHQYHESKRDMEAATEALKGSVYDEKTSRETGGLKDLFLHGHRERADDGVLGGVLADHVARYRFASRYSAGKDVLDVPCGTGYGRKLVMNAKTYTGVDVDVESVDFAKQHYRGADWRIGNMLSLPVGASSTDLLLCFEGVEHVDDKRGFLNEMKRVLRPGGTFIISTPQRGVARGTMWDRYMMSVGELMSLFKDDGCWRSLDWFHQKSYAFDAEPVAGQPSEHDEIMVLGGTLVK